MSKSRLFSGKIKKLSGGQLTADRYDYLDASQAEPDLGLPPTENSLLVGKLDGTRVWADATGSNFTFGGVTVGVSTVTGNLYVNGEIIADKLTIQYTTITTTLIQTDDVFNIQNETQSTSTENGALVVAGGVGIGLDLQVGGAIFIDGISIGYGYTGSRGYDGSQGDIGFTGSRGDTGFVGSQGDLGYTGSAGIDGTNGTIGLDGYTGSKGDTGFTGSAGSFTGTTAEVVYITNTSSSVSTNTGALQVIGGVGIGENLHVGGQSHFYVPAIFDQTVTFNGTSTIVLSTNTVYTDSILELHKSSSGTWTVNDGRDIGIVGYYYDEATASEKKFFFGFQNEEKNFEFLIDGTETTGTNHFAGAHGNLKLNKILLTSTETSTSSVTGALVVPGGVGVQGNLNIQSTGKLTVGVEIAAASLPNVPAQFSGNVNSYFQINSQNINSGPLASTDLVLTADNGNDSNFYTDLGIASSGANYPDFSIYGANDSYLLAQGGNLVLATGATGKTIEFWTGGTAAPGSTATFSTYGTRMMSIGTATVRILTETASTGLNTGALVVAGGVGIGGALHVSGAIFRDGVAVGYGYTGSLGYTGSRGYDGSAGQDGATGYTGSFGFQGFTGSQGYTGSQGFTGSAGFTGSVGNTGGPGDIGYTGSAGFTGSVGFVGSQGDLGYTGSEGVGFTGSQGDKGYTGSEGFTGSQGYTGSAGFTGSQGTQGDLGYTGSQGVGFTGSASTATGFTGSIGYTGSKGNDGTSVTIIGSTSTYSALPDPYLGNIGDGYITSDNGYLNVWTGSAWNAVGAIIGYTGSLGYTGSAGADGTIGVDGYTGSAGFTGSRGTNGTDGYTGSRGDVGFTGSEGFTGSQGYTGSQGDLGYTGSQGAGFTGSQGNVGFTGSEGYTGSAGAGFTGSAGTNGYNGSEGFTGSQGFTGSAGSRGESSYTYSINAPFNPALGDRWFNTNYGIELVWTDDGDTTQWVEISASGYLGQLGYTGSKGEQGIDGAFAGMGYTGSASTATGYTGSQGIIGDTGAKGDIGYTGSQGLKGDTGSIGTFGYTGSQGLRSGLQYLFDPTVTAAGIVNGRIRFNSTVTSSVGEIYISKFDVYGSANENYILSWDDSTNPDIKGQILFKKNANLSTATVVYNIVGPITTATDYLTIPVSVLSGSLSGFILADQMAVEHSRTGDVGYTGSFGYTGSLGGFDSIQTINLQTGTTYTLTGSDVGRLVEFSNASGTTVTVPVESSVNFAIGQRLDLQQLTAGPVIVTAAPGVTLNTVEDPILNNQFSIGTLIKTGSNEWSFIAPAATGYTGSFGLTGYTGSFGLTGFVGSAGTVSTSTGLTLSPVTLTTATVGRLEYDGRVPYFTPQGLQRGLLPDAQFFRLNAGLAGANATSAQNTLGVGVTLSTSTVYRFEAMFAMSKTAGVTSNNVSLLWGGTASINNISYFAQFKYNATSFATVPTTDSYSVFSITTASTTILTGIASAGSNIALNIRGTVSVNAAGTFIPQYILSAAPGGAYTTQVGSYMMIYPIGVAGANTNVGTWA